MNLPIFVIERGDNILAFRSVESAERYLEPADVKSGEYAVFDSVGQRILLDITTESKVLFSFWEVNVERTKLRPAEEWNRDYLVASLRAFLTRLGEEAVYGDDLEQLIAKVIPYALEAE